MIFDPGHPAFSKVTCLRIRSGLMHWPGGVLSCVFFALIIASFPVRADTEAAKNLAQLLAGVQSFSASFVQSTLGANGRAVSTQRGSMQIARPNRFRWEVTTPLPLLVVADGTNVYVYDKDLEQVTINSLDPSQLDTPAILLSGDPSRVVESFSVVQQHKGKKNVFALMPLNNSSPYITINLSFAGDQLVEIRMQDSFGQYSIVELRHHAKNTALTPETFSFSIPEGVDILRNYLP